MKRQNEDEGDIQSKKQLTGSDDEVQSLQIASTTEQKNESNENIKILADEIVKSIMSSKEDAENAMDCAVCFGHDDTLSFHRCPQCVPNAWKICAKCESSILSRICPVCRSDYASLEFHSFDDSFNLNAFNNNPELHNSMVGATNLAKINLMTYENIAIWCPGEGKLWFSLPKDPTLPPKQIQYMRACISVPSDAVASVFKDYDTSDNTSPIFLFSNKIWDDLESSVENDSSATNDESATNTTNPPGNGDMLDIRQSMRWMTSIFASPIAANAEENDRVESYPPSLRRKIMFTRLNHEESIELVRDLLQSGCS
jgi:hypothetical protein